MSAKDNGGPAFPELVFDADSMEAGSEVKGGMSLRDYFAGQALTRCQPNDDDNAVEGLAAWAYALADAMLAERAK